MTKYLLDNYAWSCLAFGLIAFLCLDGWITKFIHAMSERFQQKYGWDNMLLAKYLAGALMSIWIFIALVATLSDLRTLVLNMCVAGLLSIPPASLLLLGKKARGNSLSAKVMLIIFKQILWIALIAVVRINYIEEQPLQWVAIMALGVIALIGIIYLVAPINKKCTDNLPCRYPGISA
ncbi:MAG: hypothetical protein Q7T51_02980 [Candidatus Moranbacteria bacterium]|nr:hypothetical protein [Candidatus Moranbacteria bacterium]